MRDLSHKIGITRSSNRKSTMLFILLHVICVIQIMSAIRLDTFINVLLNKNSAIGTHLMTAHEATSLLKESQFCIPKKCQGIFDYLVHEMLFIKQRMDHSKHLGIALYIRYYSAKPTLCNAARENKLYNDQH